MPSIESIETALPERAFSPEDVSRIGETWLREHPPSQALFNRLLRSAQTTRRHFTIDQAELLSLSGLQRRSELFEQHGPPLGARAVAAALARTKYRASDIGSFVFTSCSCPPIPSIDILILEQLGFPREISRLPIYQHGCAAGVIGLGLAADLSMVRGPVVLAAVELCTLVFQPSAPTPTELVGSALFADGAGCAVISPADTGLVFIAQESFLVPNSRHLMGYDIRDDGMHLRLDKSLPQALAQAAPQRVTSFLERNGLSKEDVEHWLFHPGGVKILDFLEDIFQIDRTQCRWSHEVLSSVGNLSSATVLFVLQAFLNSSVARINDYVLLFGVGPGLTIELILFQWRGTLGQ